MYKVINVLSWIIIKLCNITYRYYGEDIFYIEGTGKDYPDYLLYTRKKSTSERMKRF